MVKSLLILVHVGAVTLAILNTEQKEYENIIIHFVFKVNNLNFKVYLSLTSNLQETLYNETFGLNLIYYRF